MIGVRLYGGLGNQLFQYATGLGLAESKRTTVGLDFTLFAGHQRKFQLNQFQIPAAQRVKLESIEQAGGRPSFLPRVKAGVQRRIDARRVWYKRHLVKEPTFDYNPDLFRARSTCVIDGYWQSHRYFAGVEDLLRKHLTFVREAAPLDTELCALMSNTESLAVHVRRGDYLSAANSKIFAQCTINYYIEAVQTCRDRLGDVQIFMFSDDLDWCRDNLGMLGNMKLVSLGTDLREFRHMSLCKHHVISNSTFAWWAAWLGKGPNQCVVAPLTWFKDRTHNIHDLVPEGWQILAST